jgi:hypothetical protein
MTLSFRSNRVLQRRCGRLCLDVSHKSAFLAPWFIIFGLVYCMRPDIYLYMQAIVIWKGIVVRLSYKIWPSGRDFDLIWSLSLSSQEMILWRQISDLSSQLSDHSSQISVFSNDKFVGDLGQWPYTLQSAELRAVGHRYDLQYQNDCSGKGLEIWGFWI